MKVRFIHSDKRRERDLAASFIEGVRRGGNEAEAVPLSATPDLRGCDVACMVGVKSARLFHRCREANVVPIIWDKGYCRERAAGSRVWNYWRVSIAAHHPTQFLTGKGDKNRFAALGIQAERWRSFGFQIVIAGSSQKYHDFYGLPDPTTWAQGVVEELRRHTDRPIIYRPKPSWHEAVAIRGTHFSNPTENINHVLKNAWALVTHGSNACFEAALAGIPSIVLGNAVARPISSTSLADINDPLLHEDRGRWLNQLCQWQWTEEEMRRGSAWKFLRPTVEGILKGDIAWPE